jgi:3-oxoacyl-(acyl-carrier-protein) synthase
MYVAQVIRFVPELDRMSSHVQPSSHRCAVRIHVPDPSRRREPVVITGIGMVASVGDDRESVWQAIRRGQSGVRSLAGVPGVPPHLRIGAVVEMPPEFPGQLKVIQLARRAAAEALADANAGGHDVDRDRFACAVSGHVGDTRWWVDHRSGEAGETPARFHAGQWLPNSACWDVATRFQLHGPRICHSTACASGLIDILSAVRSIEVGQCDLALAGSAEAIDPLFAAGFQQMRVLAHHEDPRLACRPFHRDRGGFVMGEGAAMFVLERLSHALARGVPIYAQFVSGQSVADAHHVTGLDVDSSSLTYLITEIMRKGQLSPADVGYINAHGTGTLQNDVHETRGIRRALGEQADLVCVSSTKSMLGHLVNASGSVELAITTLALRDGFAPPTLNLTDPDPECDLDCLPQVGRSVRFQHALKLSLAFGGHLVAVALRRWNDVQSGFAYPQEPRRRAA